jgi:peptidoglycan hydrolase CwlO-like protein
MAERKQTGADGIQQALRTFPDTTGGVQGEIAALRGEITRLQEANAALRNQNEQRYRLLGQYEQKIDTLNETIRDLKAELYDYIAACGILEEP